MAIHLLTSYTGSSIYTLAYALSALVVVPRVTHMGGACTIQFNQVVISPSDLAVWGSSATERTRNSSTDYLPDPARHAAMTPRGGSGLEVWELHCTARMSRLYHHYLTF